MLSCAPPAAARVVYGTGSDVQGFAVDAGALFVGRLYSVRRVDLRGGARATPYRAPKGYRVYGIFARGGRLAIGMDEDVEPGGPPPRVDSAPESGGPATVVARNGSSGDCARSVLLAGMTEAGETVTDEMDCHAPLVDYPGTLYAYAPDGTRRVFGTRKVPDPGSFDTTGAFRVRAPRYTVLTGDPRGPGQGRVFLAGPRGARRLVKTWLIESADLDSRGDAVVSVDARGRPHRGHAVVKLFRPGAPARIVAESAESRLIPRFCGDRLAILAIGEHRLRLTVRDSLTARPRVVFDRRTKARTANGQVECDAQDLVWQAFVFPARGGARNVLHAERLGGGPAKAAP